MGRIAFNLDWVKDRDTIQLYPHDREKQNQEFHLSPTRLI